MQYEELVAALHKEGVLTKTTPRVLYALLPEERTQILVRWGKNSHDEENLLCYVGLEYGFAEATGMPLEEVTLAHVAAYAAAWKAECSKR